ncbi:hypothetical protein GF415_04995 [Candidatus Micrarchaeota archaeon]|nr:hypothetical protein [Candidatus Micrarchaeota archaeon]
MEEFGSIETEEKMTKMNPLSSLPGRVMNVRETCLLAFRDAKEAFGEQMGPEYERVLENIENAKFSISADGEEYIISTQDATGHLLALGVEGDTITLTLARDGKEDTITYREGEITRKRQV